VVFAMNGIPWWFCHRIRGRYAVDLISIFRPQPQSVGPDAIEDGPACKDRHVPAGREQPRGDDAADGACTEHADPHRGGAHDHTATVLLSIRS
jgi:hypothetical protein